MGVRICHHRRIQSHLQVKVIFWYLQPDAPVSLFFRLFTQVHLLIDGSVEGQYVTPIRPPKSIKDRLKNLSPIRPEQLNQKSQAPISQVGKIQKNTKVNTERPGSTFEMPSRPKLPIRTKQCDAQGSTKHRQRTCSIESMDSDTERVVASLNLEEIINNYSTWNHLTVDKHLFKYQSLTYHMYQFKCVQTNG